jgi:hypothetical protein
MSEYMRGYWEGSAKILDLRDVLLSQAKTIGYSDGINKKPRYSTTARLTVEDGRPILQNDMSDLRIEINFGRMNDNFADKSAPPTTTQQQKDKIKRDIQAIKEAYNNEYDRGVVQRGSQFATPPLPQLPAVRYKTGGKRKTKSRRKLGRRRSLRH